MLGGFEAWKDVLTLLKSKVSTSFAKYSFNFDKKAIRV